MSEFSNNSNPDAGKDDISEKKEYYLFVRGERIEVSQEVFKALAVIEDRAAYLAKTYEDEQLISYDALDTESYSGAGVLPDITERGPEEQVLADELSVKLHRCIALLPRADRMLIQAIYFDGKTEEEYATQVGYSQSGISRKLKRTLSKLKNLMSILGSFLFFVIPALIFSVKG